MGGGRIDRHKHRDSDRDTDTVEYLCTVVNMHGVLSLEVGVDPCVRT